jgi:uncharacterized membrane protein YbhN (UPF0104 family)
MSWNVFALFWMRFAVVIASSVTVVAGGVGAAEATVLIPVAMGLAADTSTAVALLLRNVIGAALDFDCLCSFDLTEQFLLLHLLLHFLPFLTHFLFFMVSPKTQKLNPSKQTT